MRIFTKNDKGFSLLEMLLTAAVGVVIVIGGLEIYTNIKKNNDVDETIQFMRELKDDVKQFYFAGDYGLGAADDMSQALIESNAIPQKYIMDDGTLNVMGYGFRLETSGAGNKNFRLRFLDLEREDCIRLSGVFKPSSDKDLNRCHVRSNMDYEACTVSNFISECNQAEVHDQVFWRFN